MYNGWGERKTRRAIFLSFDFGDIAYVNAFRSLAKNKYIQLDIRDRSLRQAVRSRNNAVIEEELLRRIHGCSVCVCLIGRNTWQSDWVNWEVETSAAQGRGILGIRFSNAWNASVPDALRWVGAEVIPWVPHEFEDAIERTARAAGY